VPHLVIELRCLGGPTRSAVVLRVQTGVARFTLTIYAVARVLHST
jgi:hypothetical protein